MDNHVNRPGTPTTRLLIKRTICIPGHYDHREAIRGVAEAIGVGNILGIAKTAGEWQVTVNEKVNMDRIVENGIDIAGRDVTMAVD